MKGVRIERWLNTDACLAAASALDTVRRDSLSPLEPVRAYADMLHQDYLSMLLQDSVPMDFESEVLMRWAQENKLPHTTIGDISWVLRNEIQNLLWISAYRGSSDDIGRAKRFCLFLHRAACAYECAERL